MHTTLTAGADRDNVEELDFGQFSDLWHELVLLVDTHTMNRECAGSTLNRRCMFSESKRGEYSKTPDKQVWELY